MCSDRAELQTGGSPERLLLHHGGGCGHVTGRTPPTQHDWHQEGSGRSFRGTPASRLSTNAPVTL